MEVAKSKSIYTIALTGSGGKMKDLADCAICIPSEETPRIQECHILTGHIICEIAEEMLLDPAGSKISGSDFTQEPALSFVR